MCSNHVSVIGECSLVVNYNHTICAPIISLLLRECSLVVNYNHLSVIGECVL